MRQLQEEIDQFTNNKDTPNTQQREQPTHTPKPANMINHMFNVQKNLPQFRKETIIVHLEGDPRQDQLEQFYDTIANMMHIYELPLLHRKDLTKNGTTCPTKTYLPPDVVDNVNRTLYQKLIEIVPDEATQLRDILSTYSNEQDGYRALYSILRTKCKYLRLIQPTWGPTWNTNQNGYQYLATFKSFIEEEKRYYRQYTPYDQAAEVLQQAAKHDMYTLIATSYLTKLMHTQPAARTNDMLLQEYNPNTLINILESSKTTLPVHTTNPNLSINKFNRKPFQHKVQKQCTACKLWGHDIYEQVCRICAQIKHCTDFIEQQPEIATKNATAFALAHNRNKVSRVRQALSDHSDDEETIMSLARAVTMAHDDSSDITTEIYDKE